MLDFQAAWRHVHLKSPVQHTQHTCQRNHFTAGRGLKCKLLNPSRATRDPHCSAVQDEAQLEHCQNGARQPGLIFESGRNGSWDAGAVSNPIVRCYWGDNEHRWMMWYNGVAADAMSNSLPPSSIGLAISTDGVRWQRDGEGDQASEGEVGRVLGPNSDDWWCHDTRHVSVSDVQIFSSDAVNTGVGVYWMFYSGGSFEETSAPAGFAPLTEGQQVEGLRTRIGLAMSQDGRNWARIEANHHTGALFDAGETGEWDEILNGAPQVEAIGPKDMRMYYHSYSQEQQRWTVGLATSADGFKWEKRGPIFHGTESSAYDARGAASHHIVMDVDARRWVMFYEAVAEDDSRTISLAVSKNGIDDWKCLGSPILSPEDTSLWDSGGVGAPCGVSMEGGKWRLYYSGRQKQDAIWRGVGLAISDTSNDQKFEGVRIAFKRRNPQ